MWKFLLGPLLTGAAYLAGSYYGASDEQLVRKPPADVYAAVEQTIENVPSSGTTHFEGGTPMPYEVRLERTPEQRLVMTIWFGDRQGAETDFDFASQDEGRATLITARIHGDRSVLGLAFAGTDKAKLAYAPDWMLNLTARPVLRQLAEQIEHGADAGAAMPGLEPQADAQSQLSPEQQKQIADWRQYDASRPAVDPDAAARNFTSGSGN